jgi:hypothetical protein
MPSFTKHTSIYWSCYCTVKHFCDIMWSFWMEANLGRFFLSFLYISIVVGEPVIKRGRVGITLTGLTPPYLCACPKPGPGFPTSYIWVFFCFRWVEVRGDCLFCWYWWNCSPLLFKLYKKKIQMPCDFIYGYGYC